MHMAWQDRGDLLVAAMLHDIGKRAIPKQILRKSTRLTDEEYKLIRKHAEIGSYICRFMDFRMQSAMQFAIITSSRTATGTTDVHTRPDMRTSSVWQIAWT